MDMKKIGNFIASCRKEKGYTQAALAEKLSITDRAVSKWENGKSLPDASIMLELCNLLDINVNELLTGGRLDMKNYKEIAEENLIQLKKQEELNNKKLLMLEKVIGGISSAGFFALIFFASFFDEKTALIRITMILSGFVIFIIGMIFALKIEHDAGYYECSKCRKRYIPSMRSVVMAPHIGLSRKLKCPYCNKRNYHKKVLTK